MGMIAEKRKKIEKYLDVRMGSCNGVGICKFTHLIFPSNNN